MVTGVEDAVVLTDQLVFGKFADAAELVVNIGNRALDVGHGHDAVLVESELLIGQFLESTFSSGEAFLQCLFGLFARREVGLRLQHARGPRLPIAVQYPCPAPDNAPPLT